MRFVAMFVVGASVTVTACGGFEGVNASTDAIDEFHGRLDAGEFDAIWDAAHPDFRESTEKSDLVDVLAAVARKLGKVESSRSIGMKVHSRNADRWVSVTRNTTFAEGTGNESFVFRLEGGKALLAGYEISSKDLIVK